MASLNRCTFIGNVGADPEIKSMNSGDRVANFSLACTEKWKDKNSGETKERTEWVRVVVWNEGLLKVVESYVKKGSQIFVEGAMQTRKYDKNGVDHYTTEIVLQKFQGTIVLLGSKDRDQSSSGASSGGGGYAAKESGGGSGGQRDSFPADIDDEIPFISSDSVW